MVALKLFRCERWNNIGIAARTMTHGSVFEELLVYFVASDSLWAGEHSAHFI